MRNSPIDKPVSFHFGALDHVVPLEERAFAVLAHLR
jgi:hypothetical protein